MSSLSIPVSRLCRRKSGNLSNGCCIGGSPIYLSFLPLSQATNPARPRLPPLNAYYYIAIAPALSHSNAVQSCRVFWPTPGPRKIGRHSALPPALTLLFHPLAGKTQRWTTAMDAPPSKCASCWIGLFSHSQSHSVYVPIYPYSTGSGSRST